MRDKSSHPLVAWLNRKHPLPERFYNDTIVDVIDGTWNCWVAIEERQPLHLADRIEWSGLEESRQRTAAYLKEASEIISGLEGGWLDSEESLMVREAIGEPPPPCLPIYFIGTQDKDESANVAYIGITRTNNRFSGGHKAALHLHAPEYQNHVKYIYQASVWFYDDKQYLPLEWLLPSNVANTILESIESQLIYDLRPPMNERKKEKDCATIPLEIHVENFAGDGLAKDHFVYPER